MHLHWLEMSMLVRASERAFLLVRCSVFACNCRLVATACWNRVWYAKGLLYGDGIGCGMPIGCYRVLEWAGWEVRLSVTYG